MYHVCVDGTTFSDRMEKSRKGKTGIQMWTKEDLEFLKEMKIKP